MKRIGIYLCLGGVLFFLLFCPKEAMLAAGNGLTLCAGTVIPSLFPFFVLSSLLIQTGFLTAFFRPVKPLFCWLFGLSPAGAGAFFLGACAGYPLGAKSAVELAENGQISKQECSRLLAFCNNAGPLFLVGTVGVGMFQTPSCGYLLLCSHLISACLLGILFRQKQEKWQTKTPSSCPLSWNLFSDAVNGAVNSILSVCGYLVLFQVIIGGCLHFGLIGGLTSILTGGRGSGLVRGMLTGIVEMTSGVHAMSQLPNVPLRTLLTAVSSILGFGGLCVHTQTFGIIRQYNKKTYLIGKLLQGMFSPLLTYFFYPVFLPDRPVFYTHVPTRQELNGQLLLTLTLLALSILLYVVFLTVTYLQSKKR